MARSLEGKHPSYYESILQLRDCDTEVITFVEKEVPKIKLQVAKKVTVKNGIDYYMSDNDLTKKLGKKLQTHFGGELNVTATLHTKKKNDELYRLTVLFRALPFQKGDKVNYQGEQYNVKSVQKDIFLQHVKTGKKIHVKLKNMKEVTSSSQDQ